MIPLVLLLVLIPMTSLAQPEWTPTALINGATEDHHFGRVVCDPSDPDIVWALTATPPDPMVAAIEPAQGVFRSTDRGLSWTQVNDSVLRPEINALDIAVSPQNSDVDPTP
jgi:hypothetical protein